MSGDTAIKTVKVAALRIRVVRGTRVILDADLAELYDVETRVLTQAVRRNPDRFPDDFVFELTHEKWVRPPKDLAGRRTASRHKSARPLCPSNEPSPCGWGPSEFLNDLA